MDKKDVFKKIQDVKSSTPVVVLGSGASVPYGIPGMTELANELKAFFNSHPYHDQAADEAVKKIVEQLDSNVGLEKALLNIKVPDVVENDIVNTVWTVIHGVDTKVYDKFVKGEEINLKRLFDYVIYGNPNKTLNVISTNYDRIAEYAACQTDCYINIGFTHGLIGKLKESVMSHPQKPENDYTGFLNILKVHGSLDWFRRNEQIYNFPNSVSIPTGYTPCIVTPGTNKYERTQHEPHRQLLSSVDNVFKDAQNYICVGYGFNDNHVQEMLLKYAKKRNAKILIVTKDITDSIRENVIDKGYDFIAIYSDGAEGTIIQIKSDKLTIADEIYWDIDGLMKI